MRIRSKKEMTQEIYRKIQTAKLPKKELLILHTALTLHISYSTLPSKYYVYPSLFLLSQTLRAFGKNEVWHTGCDEPLVALHGRMHYETSRLR
jgi:hypothetical protein